MKDPRALNELIEDLNEDELETLGNLVGGLNRLAMEDGSPVYNDDEIDLIGRFADVPQADDEDSDNELELDDDGEPTNEPVTGVPVDPTIAAINEDVASFGNAGWGNDGDGNSGTA